MTKLIFCEFDNHYYLNTEATVEDCLDTILFYQSLRKPCISMFVDLTDNSIRYYVNTSKYIRAQELLDLLDSLLKVRRHQLPSNKELWEGKQMFVIEP